MTVGVDVEETPRNMTNYAVRVNPTERLQMASNIGNSDREQYDEEDQD